MEYAQPHSLTGGDCLHPRVMGGPLVGEERVVCVSVARCNPTVPRRVARAPLGVDQGVELARLADVLVLEHEDNVAGLTHRLCITDKDGRAQHPDTLRTA